MLFLSRSHIQEVQLLTNGMSTEFGSTVGHVMNVVTPSGTNEYGRDNMVPAFGNVGFPLALGEIGVADYDPSTSPYGYHVIKRVE